MNDGLGVVTLTAAGAIDATYRVADLERGAFVRASAYERELSGKGVNVAAALRLAGRPVAAVVVIGDDDRAFAAASPHAPVLRVITAPGATRVNTSVIDAGGATTKINAPTPAIPAEAWAAAVDGVQRALAESRAGWLVVSGTLPALAGGDEIDPGSLVALAGRAGARVVFDTSGEALSRIAAAPEGVSLLKPNTHELAELVGRGLRTVADVAEAARELVDRGVEVVYTSMGADGVLVVSARETIAARATARKLVNTAGAGDASLAGFLVGLGGGDLDDRDALASAAASAAAWGAHAVAQTSTILPDIADLPRAEVELDPDLARPLTEPA